MKKLISICLAIILVIQKTMFFPLLRYFFVIIFKVHPRVEWRGLHNVPKDESFVLASNHQSYWDPLLVTAPISTRFWYMVYKEFVQLRIFKRLRVLPVDVVEMNPVNLRSLFKSCTILKGGESICVFPEGKMNRSKDVNLLEFYGGVAFLSRWSGACIIPCTITTLKLLITKKTIIEYGKPIRLSESSSNGILYRLRREMMMMRMSHQFGTLYNFLTK